MYGAWGGVNNTMVSHSEDQRVSQREHTREWPGAAAIAPHVGHVLCLALIAGEEHGNHGV